MRDLAYPGEPGSFKGMGWMEPRVGPITELNSGLLTQCAAKPIY